MSFILFIPEWQCPALEKLEKSQFKRKQVVIPAQEHEYRHGSQHIINRNEVNIRSIHNTVIIWLQNATGYQRWTPNEERVMTVLEAFRPGKEQERNEHEDEIERQPMLSPPSQTTIEPS